MYIIRIPTIVPYTVPALPKYPGFIREILPQDHTHGKDEEKE